MNENSYQEHDQLDEVIKASRKKILPDGLYPKELRLGMLVQRNAVLYTKSM